MAPNTSILTTAKNEPASSLEIPFALPEENYLDIGDWETHIPPIYFIRGERHFSVDDIAAFLSHELSTPRLARVQNLLWLSGFPHAARPLHRQILLGRQISLTEDPNEHLVWFEHKLFLKPLPEFLLAKSVWDDYLNKDQNLHRSACGIILSYTWLVRHRSDFRIAKDGNLLPAGLTWEHWISLSTSFLRSIDVSTLAQVSDRYKYGELRLTRLNTMYRVLPSLISARNLTGGFMATPSWYQVFFQRKFAWILAVFAYISVMLSAMQLGLATSELQDNLAFNRASFGFTVFTMVGAAFVVILIGLLWAVLFWYHLISTWQYAMSVEKSRTRKAAQTGSA